MSGPAFSPRPGSSPSPINYGAVPPNSGVLNGQLSRQWRAFNRTWTGQFSNWGVANIAGGGGGGFGNGTLSVSAQNGSSANTGSFLQGWNADAATWDSGGTSSGYQNACCGVQWPKNPGSIIPGKGGYHLPYWADDIFISFQFEIGNQAMGSNCYIIGAFGAGASDNPWQVNSGTLYGAGWVNGGAGITQVNKSQVLFMLKGDGTLTLGACNGTTLTTASFASGMNLGSNQGPGTNPLPQVIVLVVSGGTLYGFVNQGINMTEIGSCAGAPNWGASPVNAEDCYPFLVHFNEPTLTGGACTRMNWLAHPIEVTAATY